MSSYVSFFLTCFRLNLALKVILEPSSLVFAERLVMFKGF